MKLIELIEKASRPGKNGEPSIILNIMKSNIDFLLKYSSFAKHFDETSHDVDETQYCNVLETINNEMKEMFMNLLVDCYKHDVKNGGAL